MRSCRPGSAHADVRLEQLPRPHAAPRRDRGGPRARSSSTAPAPPARGPRTARWRFTKQLEREFADWFRKRHAIIFSTGYQANLSLIGGLCGPDDVILIDSDSHASIYDATRQTASQVVGFRHNSPESLRKKLERLPGAERNRLVVVEGLYSIRGDVAPLREIVDVCRAHRRVSARRRSALARHLWRHAVWAAPRSRACSTRSTSSSARSRSRSRASAACACRITPSCARCISSRAPTCSRRQARRRTSPASRAAVRRRPRASGAARSAVGEHPPVCARGCRSSATRSAAPNRRSCRFSPATKSARSRSGRTCSTKGCT